MMNKFNGVLLLDKPTGITSNHALQRVKRLFNTKSKAGHTGSLDPLATGMLPICFGEATKFSAFLLNSDKKYIVTMQLGIKTDTGDLDGSIIDTDDNIDNQVFTELQVDKVLKEFIGEIWQVPPIYSAIKQNGVPFYKLARCAKQSEKINIIPPRRLIKIYSLELLNICNQKKQITLEVHCSKGTYIRSLSQDVAAKLNCLATVAILRRTMVGQFMADDMMTIEEIEKSNLMLNKLLLPVKSCLTSLPSLEINQIEAKLLQNGKQVYIDNLNSKFENINSLVCLFNSFDYQLLGVGEIIKDNLLVAKRLVQLNSNPIC